MSGHSLGTDKSFVIEQFHRYEALLRKVAPNQIKEAIELAARVCSPATSDAERCWSVIWDKPLFANTRVATGVAKKAALSSSMIGAWRTLGIGGSDYEVTRLGKGTKTSAFEIKGSLARRIRTDYRLAAHRMLAIQGAAIALRGRAAHFTTAPYADVEALSMKERVQTLLAEMGSFWGHITVMHLLTDLGLSCKPDLHLVRTVRALGIAPDLHAEGVPNLRQSIAIADAVWQMALLLHESPTPQQLRYLDKVLMEFSRQGLLTSVQEGNGVAK
jgi:hypothetical protein